MRRLTGATILVAASLVLTGTTGEAVLRLFPSMISHDVLLEFDGDLRGRIAAERGLPIRQARRCLSPADRSDGGPELCLMTPGLVYRAEADSVDRELGAVVELPQDARGFCNPPAAAERESSGLVVLGDSFTWCSFVPPETTYTALLEQELGVPSYDLGFPGVGPYEYLEIFRQFGASLQPRMVVMAFYEGNDLRDTLHFLQWQGEAGRPPETEWRALVRAHSYLANFVVGSLRVLLNRYTKPRIDFTYNVTLDGREIVMNVTNVSLGEAWSGRRLRAGEIDLAVLGPPVRMFRELARTHRFVPVLAYLPSGHSAFASVTRFNDEGVGQAVRELSQAQRATLADLAHQERITFVDCTIPFQAEVVSGELAYFPANLHFTRRGHAIAATCLRDTLKDLLAQKSEATGQGGAGREEGAG
jgi:hypothetical protein